MSIYDFTLLNVPFANNAPSNEIDAFPDFNRGLGIAFDQTDGKPEMKGLNGLFQQITTSIIYLKQRGISDWDNSLEYPVASFVVSGGALYKAKTQNTNKNPATSQNDWQIWASVSDITVSTNGNLKKTANSNGSIHLEVPTADTVNRGAMRFANPIEIANRSNVQASVRPSDIPDMSESLTTNGYKKIGNLIIQWGFGNANTVANQNANTQVGFNIPFPNAPLAVQTTPSNSYNNGYITASSESLTRYGFTLVSGSSQTKTYNYTWFAIGF